MRDVPLRGGRVVQGPVVADLKKARKQRADASREVEKLAVELSKNEASASDAAPGRPGPRGRRSLTSEPVDAA